MLIKYKDAEYNNKIEDLRNNGYTVNFVAFDYDDFIMEEGNPVPFIELQLPNGGKSYNDYTAIVAWSDYLENDNPNAECTHSGMPVPSTFTVQDGDTPVNCYYVIEDTATEGVVRFSRAITSQGPFSNEDFSYFAENLSGLMFIEGHEYPLEPDKSLIVPNLEAFFAQASGAADFQLNIANKTKLLSLGDNEVFSAYRYYKIIPSIPHGESSVIEFDGTSYHTENSSYQLLPLPIGTVLNLTGYTKDELNNTDVDIIYQKAQENSDSFENSVTNTTHVCLCLEKGLIYPISRPLTLKSNLHIDGNGGTIMAYKRKNVDGASVAKEMHIIKNAADSLPVSNVTFANLTFKGRFDGSDNCVEDQCVKTLSEYPLIKNLTFENVTFTGFTYAVHTGSGDEILPSENFNWSFNNCEFNNVKTGFMISWSRGINITNSHIDDSLCIDDKHHCVYIARGSSYINIDNCLLENSVGCGIVNSDALIAEEHRKMHHNTFTNLQIRNCSIGMIIGSWSEHITIKNIIATNVGRAIKLINCTDVNIDNFNATGCFYYEYFRKDKVGETRWVNSPSEWNAISTLGFVQAKITNSFFSTGGAMFTSAKSGLLPDDYDYRIVTSNLEFTNCVFVSTFSEHKLRSDGVSYYQPGASLGVDKVTTEDGQVKEFYYYNVNFDNCQFYMNSENNESPMISLYGYKDHPSIYKFNDCLVAYRDGNGTPEDNHPEKADSMPDGFFIYPDKGTWVEIEDCVFYVNKANAEGSSECGFVMDDYLYMDEIESDNERCLIKSYSKYHLFN